VLGEAHGLPYGRIDDFAGVVFQIGEGEGFHGRGF
jgi:hypothetical protein